MFCIRGATTVTQNEKNEILNATVEMIELIIKRNDLKISDVVQIQFTMTKDLDAVYPAVAARQIGITEAALMCSQELDVAGSLEKCIRCAVLCNGQKKQKDVKSVYLKDAKKLRPDLNE